MSVIVSEVYDALIEAGASQEKAKAAAAAIPVGDQLATKADLVPLATHISQLEADVRVIKAVYGPIVIPTSRCCWRTKPTSTSPP